MTLEFTQLTYPAIKQLKPGEHITEHGLKFECLKKADGLFAIEHASNEGTRQLLLGKVSEGVTLASAQMHWLMLQVQQKQQEKTDQYKAQNTIAFDVAAKQYLQRLTQTHGKNLTAKTRQLNQFLVPFFKQKPLASIKTFDIEQYKTHRSQMKVKVATINRDLATLSHLINCAIEWEWLVHAPCRIKKFKEDNARISYLTPEQAKKLLIAAKNDRNHQIYLFILIGLETSMRRSEILAIKIKDIHLEQRIINIPKAKAGAREQPITEHLAKTLAPIVTQHQAQEQCQWLFASNHSSCGHTVAIERPFKRAVSNAGLSGKQITIHTLRHTAITHLVQSGVDLPTVQRISGHKSLEMVLRYSHQNGEHVCRAMDKLEQRYRDA